MVTNNFPVVIVVTLIDALVEGFLYVPSTAHHQGIITVMNNFYMSLNILLLLLLLLKKVSSASLRESDIHPISPKTPTPQYQPIDRKKRKAKRVEDYSRDRAA